MNNIMKNFWAKEYNKKYPWKRVLKAIKQRCNNPNNPDYKNYGLRGIKNFLTQEDIKFLMERDNYWHMKNPTIDRNDNDGNYELSNCRFIENKLNAQKDKYIKINQYDLNGNFIKTWNSQQEIVKKLHIKQPCISEAINGKQKSSGGFIWEKY